MIYTVEEARAAIDAGKLIVVNTDTVLGIIGDGDNKTSVDTLYKLKQRERTKSAVVLLKDAADLSQYAQDIHPYVQTFIERFWPGALTLIVTAKPSKIPKTYLANTSSIGVRVPKAQHLLQLLGTTDKTIISTSANMSGKPPLRTLSEAKAIFGEAVVYWSTEETVVKDTLPSTIVDVRNAQGWTLLREGVITKEVLWNALDKKEK